MSNSAVGAVYAQIIEDVINSSRPDFEENGVGEDVLDMLRQTWQSKLSQLQVASFPWDPKPDAPPPQQQPVAQPAQQPPAPSQPVYTQSQLSLGNVSQNLPLPQPANGQIKTEPARLEPAIKQEPGTQTPILPPNYQANPAQQRAAELLKTQYGDHANASIMAMQHANGPRQPGRPGYGPPQPQQALNAAQQAAVRPPLPQPNGAQHYAHPQVDGTSEDQEAVLMRRHADGQLAELGRLEVDNLLRQQIEARAKRMEGGGLMVPLKQATQVRAAGVSKRDAAKSSQMDAADDDDDEVDEDAINSDLDDPEDDQDEDDEDDEQGTIMICMYDKVQRVKNKWKCTLKDGVLTVAGKEYVFHKATGEYEW